MGTLKFRFMDGKSVLYYETDGTDDGTCLYYCPLEDCIKAMLIAQFGKNIVVEFRTKEKKDAPGK